MKTYDELRGAVSDWLMRDDLENQVATFIQFAESEINRRLRVMQMVQRSRATARGQYLSLPSDWAEAKNIQRMSDGKPLMNLSLEAIDDYRWKHRNHDQYPVALDEFRLHSNEGKPRAYALFDGYIELAPAPTEDDPEEIEMIYYRRVPSLSEDRQENWLLKRDPDAYLYGALIHSAPFLREDERIQVWTAMFDRCMGQLEDEAERAKHSGSSMVRPRRTFG